MCFVGIATAVGTTAVDPTAAAAATAAVGTTAAGVMQLLYHLLVL